MVGGPTSDSRKVKKGGIFVAIKGLTSDGHDYIDEAIKNGASVIYGEKDLSVPIGVKYIKVKDSREKLGELASEFYGNPSQKLKVIGVTGTKGKTTTSHLIYHILSSTGKKAGLVSSVVAKIGEKEVDTGFHVTSPDVISLHKFLREMVDVGCEYAVIEVSSHGIDQKRIAGVKFDIAVLTHIAPEHLDYHKTFKEYKKTKMSFLNSAKIKVVSPKSSELNILPGEFNNLNAEAAIEVAAHLGITREKALDALKTFKLPAGRMEEIKNNFGINIYVDFAHTPDSLEAALKYLRTKTEGKLIAVFGCAGERDVRKRRKMGKISGELADLSVFTAEDPRSENIFDIFRLMKREAKNYVLIPERGEAIAYALSVAKKGDTVAVFGKGHEKSMAYKGHEHPWSDHEAIRNFLGRNLDISAIILAGGRGTRMKSDLPKVLHEICGRPMISYTLENLRGAKVGEIVTVVSFRKNLVIREVGGVGKVAVQKNPKGGTGDAVRTGFPQVSGSAKSVMVLYGDDTAFYTPQTISGILDTHEGNHNVLTFITLEKEEPRGLGRIVRNKKGEVTEIVEEKNASEAQRKIKEVNDGLYVFDKNWLKNNINKIVKDSLTGEYYINELIRAALVSRKAMAYKLPNDSEWQGINTPEELAVAKLKMEARLK